MDNFIRGFKRGVKQSSIGYWAPAVALWVLLKNTTVNLVDRVSRLDS